MTNRTLSVVRERTIPYGQLESSPSASSENERTSERTFARAKSLAIHERAMGRARKHLTAESDLIESLREVDDDRTFELFDCTSLYHYATSRMKLSEDVACDLIAIMRKSKFVPELAQAIKERNLTASKARKIVPVINEANKQAWLELATSSTSKVIEKAVATENPKLAVTDSIKYKSADRLEFTLGVSEEWVDALKLVKDLVSQKKTKAVSSEGALLIAMKFYIDRLDPLEKAKRSEARKKLSVSRRIEKRESKTPGAEQRRRPLSASLKNFVTLRDERRCTHKTQDGIRCEERRWLDVHHVIPISEGGSDDLKNLTTLCSQHHRKMHRSPFAHKC